MSLSAELILENIKTYLHFYLRLLTQISRVIYMVNPRQSCDAAEIMDQYHTNTSYNHPDSNTPGGISLYSDKVSSQKCVFVRLYI